MWKPGCQLLGCVVLDLLLLLRFQDCKTSQQHLFQCFSPFPRAIFFFKHYWTSLFVLLNPHGIPNLASQPRDRHLCTDPDKMVVNERSAKCIRLKHFLPPDRSSALWLSTVKILIKNKGHFKENAPSSAPSEGLWLKVLISIIHQHCSLSHLENRPTMYF